jgi:trigger factor
MQVTQTLKEGLKREYRVQVTATDLAARAEKKLEELKGRVQINGFRPGKVPAGHLKRMYGRNVMAENIDAIINEASEKIANDNSYKYAGNPVPKLPEDEAEAMKVFDGKADLDFAMTFEILPTIEIGDLSKVSIEKPVTELSDEELEKGLKSIADSNRPFTAKDGKAATGDAVNIDFLGRIDGVAFDGGAAEGTRLVLGSGQFIPGFEDQLVGFSKGDKTVVKVNFPADYGAEALAGKEAEFDVTVNDVEAPGDLAINDDLAKMVGFDDLDKLKDAMKDRMGVELTQASRAKAKRALLDALDKSYTFELPQGLVEQEFNNVWSQVNSDLQANNRSFADEDTTEEKARSEYRTISERRVRLGLLLADIGAEAKVEVTDEELTRAVIDQVRRYPGQEKQIYDYFRNNRDALAGLRAPLYEEKVVDHIMTLINVTEKKVTREELFKDDELPTA